MSLSTNAFPFISFIFNIFVIVASFSFSAVGTYVIVKKPKSNSVFLLITLIVITGFLIFMTYYANKYHQHYYYNDFLHFIKVMRFGN